MTRWKLTLEYDGAGFCGWQRQASDITVQSVIEEAIHLFSGEVVRTHVAGRTDAGVHARAQVAHFDLAKESTAATIQGALNFHVKPHRVAVVAVEAVPDTFHARFDALSRSYSYTILNRTGPPALDGPRVWHIIRPLALEPMQEAAALLLGTHDFSTFRAQGCQAKSPIRTMDHLTIRQEGSLVILETRARSFLYHQVRNIVGTLALLGTGRWDMPTFKAAFAAADRAQGGPTAPPQGLCFTRVEYPA